jgi:hypothetical protein
VYFGYSKVQRAAKGLVWTRDRTVSTVFEKVSHFATGRVYFGLGEAGFSGKITKVTLIAGRESLISADNFQERDNDCRRNSC